MELKEYISGEFENLARQTHRFVDGLTHQELSWRPACGCNSMGLILYHISRIEDVFIQDRVQGKPEIWKAEKWYSRLAKPENDTGSHYTVDQVNAFTVPEVKDLVDYYDAVRSMTLDCLKFLPEVEYYRKVTMRLGEMTIANVLALTVSHTAQHNGEISYLRGLLRGMDK
jgi:uncharacterized damage-inducible protein DinB